MKNKWVYSTVIFILLVDISIAFGQKVEWPAIEVLPEQVDLPDPLKMFNGSPVTSVEQWQEERRPELISLFEHYMYGKAPSPPENFSYTIESIDNKALGGKATRKVVTLHFGPDGTPPVSLLVVIPNNRKGPAPVFLGLSAAGNHALMDDPHIPLTKAWIKNSYFEGTNDNRAHDNQRGKHIETWQIEKVVDRGYGVVTMYAGEISPDYDGGYLEGVHRSYFADGQDQPKPDEWGVIAAWAWGLQRGVDYIVQDKDLDSESIIVTGHSRRGKAALLAGALDERIAVVIPHQAGCGGTSPSRSDVGESVKVINTSFPHWFNGNFKKFNDKVEHLPFDQHSLLALVAPRPLLLTNATEDTWADPEGQFDMLLAINPVYELYGEKGIEATVFPKENELIDSQVGYFIRPGEHSMGAEDWEAWLDFCDKHLQLR
jgi:hypothetical protein